MHLDEEQIQRLQDGELSARAESSAREHLAGCAECRRRLAEVEREVNEVHALLRAVDESPPRIRVEAISLRAELSAAEARTREVAWRRRAAGLILALGIAGAAYAVPGSPVRGWIDAIVEKLGGRPESIGVVPAPGGPAASVSGIAVPPGQRLLILIRQSQPEGSARVSLTDGPEVQVQAPVGAATFTTTADQLLIDNRGPSAVFEIRIPRSAPSVEIRVGADRIFLKEDSRITTRGTSSATDSYVIPLRP